MVNSSNSDVIKKRPKQSKTMAGKATHMVHGNDSKIVKRLLINNGLDLEKLSPRMEHYSSILDWNKDSMEYMTTKAKVIKEFTELSLTIGGKAVEIQDEINRLSYFLTMMEKKLLNDGINPLEDKNYQTALKLKKEYLMEKSKLNLDYTKAATDYSLKKKKDGKEEDMW